MNLLPRLALVRRRFTSVLFAAAGLLFAAGCANTGGEYSYVTRIATGERMTFPLVNGQPSLAKSGTITIRVAGLNRAPGKEKAAAYEFGYEDSSGATPKAVRVDDVSETTIFPLVEDLHPEMKHKVAWLGTSKTLDASSPELYWLPYLDDTTRIFRFTITTADDRQIVLYQPWFVASWVKAGVRTALGMK